MTTNPHFIIKFKTIGKEHVMEGSVVGKINRDLLFGADEILDILNRSVVKSRSNADFDSILLALFVSGSLEEMMEALMEWIESRNLTEDQLLKLESFGNHMTNLITEFAKNAEENIKKDSNEEMNHAAE